MSEPLRKCPGCGLFVNSKGNFCPCCGARLDSNIVVCPNCLKENRAGDKTCRFCGAFLAPSYSGQDLQGQKVRRNEDRYAERENPRRQRREERREERFNRKTREAGAGDAGNRQESRSSGKRRQGSSSGAAREGRYVSGHQKPYATESESLFYTRCPSCGVITTTYGETCRKCGAKLSRDTVICISCKNIQPKGNLTCRFCGKDLRVTFGGVKIK